MKPNVPDEPSSAEELCRQADPASAVEHLMVCAVCGQIYDCRNAKQLHHHEQPNHAPLICD